MDKERRSELLKIMGNHVDRGVLIFNMEHKPDKEKYIQLIKDDLIELGYFSTHLVNQDNLNEHHVPYGRIN